VNLMGVLHGIRTFVPHICGHGDGGHIVNTASMAGMVSPPWFAPYFASKHAVVAMSEGLAMHLNPLGIGVTVLCPGFVRTRITESQRNRPQRYGPRQTVDPASPAGAVSAQITELVQGASIPLMSPGASWLQSGTTNSTRSRTHKCATRWRSGLRPSWQQWTKRPRTNHGSATVIRLRTWAWCVRAVRSCSEPNCRANHKHSCARRNSEMYSSYSRSGGNYCTQRCSRNSA
jgi:hypothetical protein